MYVECVRLVGYCVRTRLLSTLQEIIFNVQHLYVCTMCLYRTSDFRQWAALWSIDRIYFIYNKRETLHPSAQLRRFFTLPATSGIT